MNGGLVGGRYDGVNEHGVFVALHKVMADRPDTDEPGVPYHLLPRLALQCCRSAEHAADLIMHLPQLASFNYTLADMAGTLIALECYPGKPVQRRDGDDVLAVTNHYTSPELAPLQRKRPTDESRRRKAALEAITERNADPWNATLAAISDHRNGVCCHREFGATLWAGVFDLEAKEAAYSFGAPCRKPMNKYQVSMNNELD
jgi:predicted choloylglycine hydrolase